MNSRNRLIKLSLISIVVFLLTGCALIHRHRREDTGALNPGDQPDKILYERATKEIERGRYDVGRLTLQTLINTYPDSEYLSKAKLSIADSYYNEGGTSGLTQAEAEYKDFITFFPTAPEAPEAQFRAGMAHYRLMAKADRDRTEARLAEAEFKEFLLKYPDSHVMPRVKARLRQVQEVLAQSDYKIARFYYLKRAYPAARSRFQEIAESYPNYSEADSALWYLGQSLEQLRKPKEAATYYARVLTEHPLSPHREEAKARLLALHQPIPRPTRAILARAQADSVRPPGKDLIQRAMAFLSSAPDTSATRHGPVHLGPPTPPAPETAQASTTTPGANTVVAQPVGDQALKAGTPVGSTAKSDGAGSSASGDPKGDAPAAKNDATLATDTKGSASAPTSPEKKKQKRGLLKKIIRPF